MERTAKEVKAEFRRAARIRRSSLPRPQHISWSHLLAHPIIARSQHIGSYISYGDEPETFLLNRTILEMGKTLYLPRMLDDRDLEMVGWNGDDATLQPHPRITSLREPTGPAVNLDTIQVILVPALTVYRDGMRLGKGGGSYDRLLRRGHEKSLTSGGTILSCCLVYDEEFDEEFDEEMDEVTVITAEEHDIKVDYVATPTRIVKI